MEKWYNGRGTYKNGVICFIISVLIIIGMIIGCFI